jgi:hypothetical protein
MNDIHNNIPPISIPIFTFWDWIILILLFLTLIGIGTFLYFKSRKKLTKDKTIIETIELPIRLSWDKEYKQLSRKCVNILKNLLATSKFTNEGTYEERQKRYEARSSPINDFIKEYCTIDVNGKTEFFKLYKEYVSFCNARNLRVPTKTGVSRLLTAKGFEETTMAWVNSEGKSTTIRARFGITLNEVTSLGDPDLEDTGLNAFNKKDSEITKPIVTKEVY